MAKRILVAYDTIHGSTAEIAESVGKELRKEGNVVEVRRVTEVNDMDHIDEIDALFGHNKCPMNHKY